MLREDFRRYRRSSSNDRERDGAVVFLEGDMLISKNGESHSELLGYGWSRMDIPDEVVETNYFTFGHLYGNTIFLEDWQYQSINRHDVERPHSFKQLLKIIKNYKDYNLVLVNRNEEVLKEIFIREEDLK